MTGMSTRRKSVLATGLTFAVLLAANAAFAQEEIEEAGPAVNTSATEMPEVEDIGPAVDTAVVSSAITRRTTGNRVMDSIELGRTEITGNLELPKVLYIVPWQKADPGDLIGKPVNTLLDEVLAPIDREEFLRQVGFYNDLYGNKDE